METRRITVLMELKQFHSTVFIESDNLRLMSLCSSLPSEMSKCDQGKNEMCRLLMPPTKREVEISGALLISDRKRGAI
jgi:hypothetical protein